MHASPLPVSGERNGTGASQADSLQLPKMEDHQEVHRQTGGSEMKLTPVGMEIAKPVFQVHTVDAVTGEIVNKRLKGAKLLEYFAHRGPGLAVQQPGQGVAVQTEGQQAVSALDKAMPVVLERVADRLPRRRMDMLQAQWNGLKPLDAQIAEIERRLREWVKADQAVQTLTEIPGVGVPTASAAVATIGIRLQQGRI